MIFQIKKFLKGRKNKHFQSELIEKLNKEHQKLFDVVGKMDESIAQKDIKKLQKLIKIFKQELELHVLYEDTNLYEHLYLRYHYYPEIKDEIEKKHNEIKNIASVVENFINKYQNLDSIYKFQEEFENIKQVLVKRVSFEEDILYDIYSKNYKISETLSKLKKS